ncbi:hypothetical protein ACOSP7_018129 [Xanthoceras sorbifolium]
MHDAFKIFPQAHQVLTAAKRADSSLDTCGRGDAQCSYAKLQTVFVCFMVRPEFIHTLDFSFQIISVHYKLFGFTGAVLKQKSTPA